MERDWRLRSGGEWVFMVGLVYTGRSRGSLLVEGWSLEDEEYTASRRERRVAKRRAASTNAKTNISSHHYFPAPFITFIPRLNPTLYRLFGQFAHCRQPSLYAYIARYSPQNDVSPPIQPSIPRTLPFLPQKAPLRTVKSMLNLLLSGSLLVAWLPRVLLSFAAKIPTGGSPYLALFRLDSFHRIRLSFGLVAPCALCVPWSIHYLAPRHVRYCLFSEFLPAAHHKF